jgi:hypothetical protein
MPARFHFASSRSLVPGTGAGQTDLGRFEVPPLSVVAGRSVVRQLPETAEARWLRRLLNEAQMVLHEHPANRQREDAGRATINSLWLWGAGVPAAPHRRGADSPASGAISCWPRPRARFRRPGAGAARRRHALLAQAPAGSRQLLVLDALQRVQYEDGDAYRKQLLALDARWFAPLQQALAGGRIKRLRLEALDGLRMLAWESGRASSGGCGAAQTAGGDRPGAGAGG